MQSIRRSDDLGEIALCREVQKVAEQAFWDALSEGLQADPPQWERLAVLLEEARDVLTEMIPEGSSGEAARLRVSLAEKLDMVQLPPAIAQQYSVLRKSME